MIIEYDGGRYHGFQRQDNASTVQGEIEKAIWRLTKESITIMGASRTDTGVHAKGQVIAFDTTATIPIDRWTRALNTFLPQDIRVIKTEAAGPDFHPQFQAVKKRYAYYVYRSPGGATFYQKYALCTSEALDIGEMQQACTYIEGRHNFRAFCASGATVKSFERRVLHCSLSENGPLLRLNIEADGFLYNMVRIVMGTLLQVGKKKLGAKDIPGIIASQNRCLAGPTAPPQGLYLLKVYYPGDIGIESQ